MTQTELKIYFGSRFQGMENVIMNLFSPLFGKFDPKDNPRANDYVSQYGNGGANIEHIYDYGHYIVPGGDVSVWEVVLADNCHISRARKNIQNTIRSITEKYTGAFIIFHYADGSTNPEAQTWRLSWLMRTDAQVRTSPAKRYTYLCGPSYSCRTIAERFEALHNEPNKTLATISTAFDVEALSKEFFKEYKVIYDDIVQWITGQRIVKVGGKNKKWETRGTLETGRGNDIYKAFYNEFDKDDEKATKAIRDYVKKLLGRLVFIQFLQKKGWLKIDGVASSNFLLDLFNKVGEDYQNDFIESVLEKVVYLLLNNENRLPGSDKVDELTLDVPFLNGGLFEPDACDDIIVQLPKEFFHNEAYKDVKREQNETRLRDKDKFFTQCGILDLFYQYNFTIDENDPNDAEVGVDPEMLGKIFENLLEDNKEKGAFYTPKEIVQYMCNESLIAYLQTKVPNHDDEIRQFVLDTEKSNVPESKKILNAIKEVKICDPAIGSGAFPMGLLNLLVSLREKLEGTENSRCDMKKEIICNNIYGVDIEKGAIDIARLRFWLSIMVDENTPTPLPNFDYKFMQGNSLLTTFDLQYVDIKQAKQNVEITKKINDKKTELLAKKNEFFGLSGEAKYKKELEIKLLIVEILKLRLGFEKVSVEQQDTTRQMELFAAPDMPQNSRSKKKIQEVKEAQERVQKLINKLLEIERQLNDETKTWEQRAKIDILFFDWEICFAEIFPQDKADNEIGFDIVIGNPPYKIVAKNDPQKDIFDSKYEVTHTGKKNLYHLFFEQGILKAKDNGTLSYITPDTYFSGNDTEALRKYFVENIDIKRIIHYTEKDKVFENVTQAVAIIVLQRKKHGDRFSILHGEREVSIEYSNVKKENKYIFKSSDSVIEKMKTSKMTFGDVCDGYKGDVNLGLKKGFFTKNKSKYTLPLVRGAQITKYGYKQGNEYCSIDALSQNHTSQERIIFKEVANMGLVHRTQGTILKDVICGDTCNIIFSKNPKFDNKYICAILNCKVVNYYFKFFNQTNHVPIGEFKRIPFPSAIEQPIIINMVNQIFASKKANPQVDTSEWESKIDILVYLLYGLTYDEVMVVENASQGEKLNLDKATYDKWLELYTENGALPSKEEMEKAVK